ncbi:hypothetical protein GGS23DRAFT_601379 [Durotheca rogersii]|uniref:uncharacterized protein n=1 Tax=Durotheca rogersii TaxID=419775 RepID=UPI00221ECF63|nr:uncharacterized protein GGS23DRAFT_601379 [Durotheca rogersii]KAI5855547.1 hypothetical protein GGS23DRAFT_601379 [Durotheca rogersii]
MESRWRRMFSRSPPLTSPHRFPSPANTPQPAVAAQPSSADLQARFRNQAYDEPKADEPKIVTAYEKFLSTANEIEPEQRWHLMERLVRTVSIVRGLVGKAVQTSPEAAIAWVGVSSALEGLSYVVSRMDWHWNLVDLFLDERAGPAFNGLRGQLGTRIV